MEPLHKLISQHNLNCWFVSLYSSVCRCVCKLRSQHNMVPFGDASVTCELCVFLFVSKHGHKSLLPFLAAVPTPPSKWRCHIPRIPSSLCWCVQGVICVINLFWLCVPLLSFLVFWTRSQRKCLATSQTLSRGTASTLATFAIPLNPSENSEPIEQWACMEQWCRT